MAKFYDTLLGEYIKAPGVRGLSLDKLALRDFEYEMISYDSVTDKAKINFKDVDLSVASNYSGEDVYITAKLYKAQKKEHLTENSILNDIEIPLTEVLKDMEISGVKIDRDRLKGIGILLKNEIDFLRKKIYEQVGTEFNINSPKQVGEILFDKLALPKGKKTKTGWSVSAEVLGDLAHDYPVAQDIVDYRHYTKILSTYIEGLLDIADEDDLVHTSYNQTVASTGRLSSTEPNLQNIPSSDGIAGEVRDAFVSRWEKGSIMASDYSQVEVRLLAIMSGDENLIGAFNSGVDIHHKTAEFIFGTETISSSQRKIAKAVNFGVIYGISAFGLSKMIAISQKDAKIYIDKFYESYPKVREFLDNTIKFCEEKGYVETLFGRKRYINGINDANRIIKQSAEREAINMPIQGTSADIIKIAMLEVHDFILKKKLKSKMIMQVHDELVFDVYPGEENTLRTGVFDIMQGVLKKSKHDINNKDKVELKVDIEIGKSWKDAK
ncbi:MAG: DNA polymerase [Candidatus Gracilibacteria bacterium]|nr:DNA polymerase [Candidatus Gracilibacteria bacterium]